MRFAFAITLLLISRAGYSAATETASSSMPNPLGSGAIIELVLGLVAVIGLILALAWLVRRLNVLPGQRGDMQVVAVLPLGQREKAVLIQVGEQQMLLGVSSSQVSLLEKFDTPVIEPRHAPQGAFANRLKEVMQQSGRKP
ncbi:flagellar biosynthetic protein FliO [Marinobacterium lutimaris]|uniref:Flagellar protein n=1 Tax=Marinobacterium lutimaris TaxID=568106 RepID=A0A1H6BC47_9GAMM|nr:flagellar biosynthetic protein FliO [Marinobacterium lutimaris]SEG58230.1 flagellar protein FliO/FliZ [Marinobacterium lutimaris]